MLAADRRMGIVSILVACGHATTRELAQEFGVSRRTIMHDISHLSYGFSDRHNGLHRLALSLINTSISSDTSEPSFIFWQFPDSHLYTFFFCSL